MGPCSIVPTAPFPACHGSQGAYASSPISSAYGSQRPVPAQQQRQSSALKPAPAGIKATRQPFRLEHPGQALIMAVDDDSVNQVRWPSLT